MRSCFSQILFSIATCLCHLNPINHLSYYYQLERDEKYLFVNVTEKKRALRQSAVLWHLIMDLTESRNRGAETANLGIRAHLIWDNLLKLRYLTFRSFVLMCVYIWLASFLRALWLDKLDYFGEFVTRSRADLVRNTRARDVVVTWLRLKRCRVVLEPR